MDQQVPAHTTDDAISELLDAAGVFEQRALVARLVEASVGLGTDSTSRLDLKISASALEELRTAFQLFQRYTPAPKVTIFGSARTQPRDPLYQQAEAVSRELGERGWLVVTGAGPGIMQAAANGAGLERSLGISIRLPFEETPSAQLVANERVVSMKYFFTRKLMLTKESSGFICMPGGFGTLDETFELLTLQQTGKADPAPVVLLDGVGGTFWKGLEAYVETHLEQTGLITPGDFDRVLVTDSIDAAVSEITGFWRNYDSLRWVGEQLVMRLRGTPTNAEIDGLNDQFASLLATGSIQRSAPLDVELADADRIQLPRILLTPKRKSVGELFRLIRAINGLQSAPQYSSQPSCMRVDVED